MKPQLPPNQIAAKGTRMDETLDINLQLPPLAPLQDHTLPHQRAPLPSHNSQFNHINLRRGKLIAAAQVSQTTSQVDLQVEGVHLDELELGSLRGDLDELSLHLNFWTRDGRGRLCVGNPRFSGLSGKKLSGGFRWDRDVLRLEKTVL